MAARKYSRAPSRKVGKAMHERKKGTLKSGSGRRVKVGSKPSQLAYRKHERQGRRYQRKRRSNAADRLPALSLHINQGSDGRGIPLAPTIRVGSSSWIERSSLK